MRKFRLNKWIFYAFLVALFGCQREIQFDQDTIAIVADQKINLHEFQLFYELDPNFGLDSSGFAALHDELMKLVYHKLAFKKAEEEGLFTDSLFSQLISWEKNQIMLRELYREEVERKIQVTVDDLEAAYVKSHVRVHVRHLFSKDISQVEDWKNLLEHSGSFTELAKESFNDSVLANNGGDLGWMVLWDLDDDFAAAVENLAKMEISGPVKTRWGYHIIQLLDRKNEVFLLEDDFLRKRKVLEKKVKQKKSRDLAREYIADFMKDLNPQPEPEVLYKMWEIISGNKEQGHRLSFTVLFTNQLLHNIEIKLSDKLTEPLVRFNGGEIILSEYLNNLKESPISNRPRIRTLRQLSNDLGTWVRDRFLLQEAYRQKIDNKPQVRRELREFIERQCYLHFLSESIQNASVPQNVSDYFSIDTRKNIPELRKFHTLQEWIWWKAESILADEFKNMNIEVRIDSVKLRKESNNIDWNNRVRMFVIPRP